MNEQALLRKLRGVGALHEGATTEGERAAAAKAMRRVAKKLAEARANDAVRLACVVQVARLGVPGPVPEEEVVELPDDRELAIRLGWWRDGHWSAREVRIWASYLVDRVVLPTGPGDAGACCGEILMQLADPSVRLRARDVPRMQQFLLDKDWATWFAFLEQRAAPRCGRP